MFFKVLTLYTLSNISTLLFLIYFFTGFKISESDPGYFFLLAIFLSFINYFLDPLIKFFTLKIKFLTVWLFDFLICIPFLYFIKIFIAGIHLNNGEFRMLNLGIFQINSFHMSDAATIIISSVILGFMASFIRWLMDKI